MSIHMMRRKSSSTVESGAPGQSLVEFALVAPIFFLLVFTVIQLGIIFGAQNNLVNAARDAARKAATYRVSEATYEDIGLWNDICQTIEDQFRASVASYPGASDALLSPTIVYEWKQSLTAGDYSLVARVSATYDHPLYVPFISAFLDGSDGNPNDNALTLSADEQMRVENPSFEFASIPVAPPPC